MTRNQLWQAVKDCQFAIKQMQDHFAPLGDENYVINADLHLLAADFNKLRRDATMLEAVCSVEMDRIRQMQPRVLHLEAAE